MKDTRRLTDRIAQLSSKAQPAPDGREIAGATDMSPLAIILREVEETVLPRRLVFMRGNASLAVAAANRRLISVQEVSGPNADVAKSVVEASLSRPDVAMLGRLRDALTQVLSGNDPIRVKTHPLSSEGGEFAAGTSAAALASAWGIDLAMDMSVAGPASPVDIFLGTAPSAARAWLRLSQGEIRDAGGDDEMLAHLKSFADSKDMAELDMIEAEADHRFVAVGRAPGDGDCLLLIGDRLETALLLVSSDTLETARKSWHAALS